MEPDNESQSNARRGIFGRVGPRVSIALALGAGLALRLWMLKQFFDLHGDPLIYGGLAKNLLLHGSYALTGSDGAIHATLIRLPGYPLFLVFCFSIFGMENYVSAAWLQIAMELVGCLMLADFAGRIAPQSVSRGAMHATLWLAALCPFTAVYAAQPMTESLTLFVMALALWSAARFCEKPGWGLALWFTFAVSYAALLRPDGALVGVTLAPALLMGLRRKKRLSGAKAHGHFATFLARLKSCPDTDATGLKSCPDTDAGSVDSWRDASQGSSGASEAQLSQPRPARMAVVCVLLALTPFAVWTWRNERVFHVFVPLAPRLATDPGENPHPGWERWMKSWCLDFASTYEIYWNVPGDNLDLSKLPARAFDSPAQYAETAKLAADYNRKQDLTPEIDARFGKLADERIDAHPLRSFLWLPLARMADMWLRPRVENLPIDLDWWVYAHHNAETRFSWAYAGLNALYLLLGFAGLMLRPRFWLPMLAYFVLRSAMLMTVEAPEARYTLECFPMLFALGGVAAGWAFQRVERWGFWLRSDDEL
ncbi:MAG: glycosyltransferase family 39 protein [Terracidiphilus sp.]